jgi:hypothetical protein
MADALTRFRDPQVGSRVAKRLTGYAAAGTPATSSSWRKRLIAPQRCKSEAVRRTLGGWDPFDRWVQCHRRLRGGRSVKADGGLAGANTDCDTAAMIKSEREHEDESAVPEPAQDARRAPVRRPLAIWAAPVLLLIAAAAALAVMAEDRYYDGVINVWLWATLLSVCVYTVTSVVVWLGIPWSGATTWAMTAATLPYWLVLGSAAIGQGRAGAKWDAIVGTGLASLVLASLLTATPAARRFTRLFDQRWMAVRQRWMAVPPVMQPVGGRPDTPMPGRMLRRATPPPER